MKINPTNFFKRELGYLPPHFVNTVVKCHEGELEKIRNWIYEYCSGRYSITRDIISNEKDGTVRAVFVLGFENPGDLTLFALSGMTNVKNIT